MLTRSDAIAELQSLMDSLGCSSVEITIVRASASVSPTGGGSRTWSDAHIYPLGVLWQDTRPGREELTGGMVEGRSTWRCAVLKDSFQPLRTDRVSVGGQTFEIAATNWGAIDDFLLQLELVQVN